MNKQTVICLLYAHGKSDMMTKEKKRHCYAARTRNRSNMFVRILKLISVIISLFYLPFKDKDFKWFEISSLCRNEKKNSSHQQDNMEYNDFNDYKNKKHLSFLSDIVCDSLYQCLKKRHG